MRKGINLPLIITLTVILALISLSWSQPFQVFTNGACRFGKPTEGCMAYFPKFNILPFLGNLLPRVVILFPILLFIDKRGRLTKKNIIFGFIGLLVITLTVYFGLIFYQQYNSNQILQEPAKKLDTTSVTSQPNTIPKFETANWKTLISVARESDANSFKDVKTVRFTFKYPETFRVINDEGTDTATNDDKYLAGLQTSGSIQIYALLGNRGNKMDSTKDVTLGGKNAKRDTYSTSANSTVNYYVDQVSTGEGKKVSFIFICVIKGKLTTDSEQTCDLIASTFKFLN